MAKETQRRIGRNESLFRQVNEAIARGVWPGDASRPVAFRCECARLECNLPVRATLLAYERVRSHPRRFLILDGHEFSEGEVVVERHAGYAVVEKREVAGSIAEQTDPRS